MVEGLVLEKRITKGVSFGNKHREEGLLMEKGKGQGGYGQNCPLFFLLPPDRKTGEGAAHSGDPGRRSLGHGGGWGWGKRTRRARGFFSPYSLGMGWSEEACPRWPAEGDGGASGRRRWELGEGARGGRRGRGGREDPIAPLALGGDGARWPGHGGRRRRTAMVLSLKNNPPIEMPISFVEIDLYTIIHTIKREFFRYKFYTKIATPFLL